MEYSGVSKHRINSLCVRRIVLFLSDSYNLMIIAQQVLVKLFSSLIVPQVLLILWLYLRCSLKKVFLKSSKNSLENTCARVPLLTKLQAEACNFIKKETLAEVFSSEFCEIFRNN